VSEKSFLALAQLQQLREFIFMQIYRCGRKCPKVHQHLHSSWLSLCFQHLPKLFIAGRLFKDRYCLCFSYDHNVQVEPGHTLELRQLSVKNVETIPPAGTLPRLQSLVLLAHSSGLGRMEKFRFSTVVELILSVEVHAHLMQLLKELGGQLQNLTLCRVRQKTLNVSEALVLCPQLVKMSFCCNYLADAKDQVEVPTEHFLKLRVFEVFVHGGQRLPMHQRLPMQLLLQVLQAPLLEVFHADQLGMDDELEELLANSIQTGRHLHCLKNFVWWFTAGSKGSLHRALSDFCPTCIEIRLPL
jgi:hypothetical protein